MKFALVNGDKAEATKRAKGLCQVCGSELIAKCGEVKINHWAHKGNRNCDPWWEKETDWHRAWKDNFPKDWQEVVHIDEKTGEQHIADVKTSSGWCIEFQHSHLKPEERRARNAFYGKLVWVVDGARYPTDKKQFEKLLSECIPMPTAIPLILVRSADECRLIEEWHDNDIYVFFDFQGNDENAQAPLWVLFPKMPSGATFISRLSRQDFSDRHNISKFDELMNQTYRPIYEVLNGGTQNQQANINNGFARRVPDPLAIKPGNIRRGRGRL